MLEDYYIKNIQRYTTHALCIHVLSTLRPSGKISKYFQKEECPEMTYLGKMELRFFCKNCEDVQVWENVDVILISRRHIIFGRSISCVCVCILQKPLAGVL